MYQQRFENPTEKPEVPKVAQGEIDFPQEQTPWERIGITKEEYDDLYKHEPGDFMKGQL